MTEQEELNKKLLRFAGFEEFYSERYGLWLWQYPDGSSPKSDAPNFLASDCGLSLQVKWIWPKLEEMQCTIRIQNAPLDDGAWTNWARVVDLEALRNIEAEFCYEYFDKNITIASAKATEQLIDREAL